jgi:hypothetical protein
MLRLLHRFSAAVQSSRLAAAYERYRLSPGESESLEVARELVGAGRIDEAFRWLRKARASFRGSRRIERGFEKVKRLKVAVELEDAKARARRDPSAANALQVCELIRLSGNWRKAYRESLKTRDRFPDHWEVYLVLGRLFFERFRGSRNQKHGWAAVANLEQALDRNPNDYRALLLLAMSLLRLEKFPEARGVARNILRVAPGDRRASSLLAYIKKFYPPDGAPLSIRAQPSETVRGATREGAPESERSQVELAMSIPGAVGAFRLDESGDVVDTLTRPNESFDFSGPIEIVEAMASACRLDTRRLGLGELTFCTLSGDGWSVGYRTAEEGGVLVFLEGEVSEEQVAADLQAVLGNSTSPAKSL